MRHLRIICISNLTPNSATNIARLQPLMNRLQLRGHRVKFLSNKAAKFAKYGSPTYVGIRLLTILKDAFKTCDDYDVIFASKPSAALTGYLISKRIGIPFAFDQDDLEGLLTLKPTFWMTSTRLVKAANKFFVASNWLFNCYKQIKSDAIYLPNTVDLNFFNPSLYQRSYEPNGPALLWVSSESSRTELDLILQSLRMVGHAKLVIMGKIDRLYLKQRLLQEPELIRRVDVKNWVPHKKVPDIYKQCDLALIPFPDTLWHRCKCPARLFEIMAMELPFVATIGEPAFMAERFGSGLVSRPEPEEFASKINYIINNLDQMNYNAKTARKYLEHYQNFDALTDILEDNLVEATINKARE